MVPPVWVPNASDSGVISIMSHKQAPVAVFGGECVFII